MNPRLGHAPTRFSKWGVKAEWRSRPVEGTYVRITDGLLPDPKQRSLVPLRVQTSSQWSPLLAIDDYEELFLRAHARRLSRGGQAKGRVLYLRGNQSPLAVLCWSLPPEGHPLCVVAAAPAKALEETPADAATAVELLLSCLGAIASALGENWPDGKLAWAVPHTTKENEDRVARTLNERFGFRGISRARFPEHVRRGKAAHYLLRARNLGQRQ